MNNWREVLDIIAYVGWLIWGIVIFVFTCWFVLILTSEKVRNKRHQMTLDKALERLRQ